MSYLCMILFFFFNDTATTEIYTLSLHDALPIFPRQRLLPPPERHAAQQRDQRRRRRHDHRTLGAVLQEVRDRKSTRLNSSHANISYAVFCLKKKIVQTTQLAPLAVVGAHAGGHR